MKKKIIVLTGLIVFMLVAFGGFTYAIFTNSKSQEGSNSVSTYNCLDIQITGEEEINLDNAFPIEDAEGLLQTPYKFKVKNKCNHYVKMSMGAERLVRECFWFPQRQRCGVYSRRASLSFS